MDSVASFAPKTRDSDADIRYMAIADLNSFLDSCIKNEKKISLFMRNSSDQNTVFTALLERVRVETEGTVQEQVQRCFYSLCKCPDIERDKCTNAVKELLGLIKKDAALADEASNSRREVASLSLKEALKGMDEVPQSKGIAASYAPDLFAIVQDTKAAADTRVKCCECLTVIIQNNDQYVAANPTIAKTLFMLLVCSTASSLSLFRKRLVTCIVCLSAQLSDQAFIDFVKILCEKLSEIASASETCYEIAFSLVQIIGSVAATPNGSRMANNLKDLLPVFVTLCKEPTNGSMMDTDEFEDNNNEALDELRSLVFQSCEVLLGKCSAATLLPLIQPVLDLVCKFISYGSLVTDEDEDERMTDAPAGSAAGETDNGEMNDDDDNDGFEDGGFDDFGGSDFDDDDYNDSTWKIRRDAIRCFVAISAALVQSPARFVESSKTIFNSLRQRLSETDESVLLEALSAVSSVIACCSRMTIKYCTVKTPSVVEALNLLISSSLEYAVKVAEKLSKIMSQPKTSVKVRTSCVQLAAALIKFNQDVGKRSKSGSNEKKFADSLAAIWSSVNEALNSAENASASSVSSGIPTDTAAASLKVESLRFLQAFLDASSVGLSSRDHAVKSSEAVAKCLSDPYVHAASESLRVIPVIMAALRQKDEKISAEDGKVVDALAIAVTTKYGVLGTSSLEYEVKECAITALVSILTIGGSVLPAVTFKDKCLPVIIGSMHTEMTRIVGIKALNDIASSALELDLSSVAGQAIDELKKMLGDTSNKQLRQTALAACASVLKHEAGKKSLSEAQIVGLMNVIYMMISSDDLYLSHLVISVAANALSCCSSSSVKKAFSDSFLKPVCAFIQSQPLQGATLSSFVSCFNICGKNGVFSSPLSIVEDFIKLVCGPEVTKQIVVSVATICAGYVNGIADASVKRKCVDKFISLCQDSSADNQTSKCFSMMTVGQVGRDCDLSDLLKVIMDKIAKPAFTNGSDDIRTAAASMLGGVAAGSISTYIKAIDDWSREAAENVQYYVLATLREFASRLVESNNTAGSAQVCTNVANMVKSLIHKKDEGKRNIAAECLGKLCALTPSALCPIILEMAADKSDECRTIAAGAVRVMYSSVIGGKGCAAWQSENRVLITRFIYDNAAALFKLIKDAKVQVRHGIMLTLNYLLHQNSSELIPVEVLREVAPSVLVEADVESHKELIKEVKYGPHKVKRDKGVESRKAAYECLSSLLDSYPDILSIETVTAKLGAGLRDEYDIILLVIQICCKLASSPLTNTAMLPYVDKNLLSAFNDTVFPPSRNGAKKPEEEEHQADAKKKIMRVFVLLKNNSAISAEAPQFSEFLTRKILSAAQLSAMMKEAEDSLNSSK